MKTYQWVALICIAIGLLGSMLSYGGEDTQSHLSSNLHDGIGIADNAERTRRAAALFNLGKIYSGAEMAARNDEEAAYSYRKSAELGDVRAQISLGLMYAEGRGVQKDFDEAIYWIRRATGGVQSSGNEASLAEAVAWLQEASRHGYVPAQRTLRSMAGSGHYPGMTADQHGLWSAMPGGHGQGISQSDRGSQKPA